MQDILVRLSEYVRDRSLITGEGGGAGGNEKLDVKILLAPLEDNTIIIVIYIFFTIY